ncbi:MAG: hypothetical protein DRQ39_08010 [Gammaproteobacteria bacterium]|nr:MAG: hypothetical protein DRQ39_08010 [Gammaproteobacteria bacterium]
MTLINYIKDLGNARAAIALDVKIRTIASWRYDKKVPKPQVALNIEKATQGLVTFRDCYSELAAE